MANASTFKDKKSGIYSAVFVFGGKGYTRSLKTKSKQEAKDRLGEIRSTIRKLEDGTLTVPADAEIGTFLLTAGRLARPVADTLCEMTLDEISKAYLASWPEGGKGDNTLKLEASHLKTLAKHLKGSTPFRTINTAKLQGYVKARSADVVGATIEKELGTFSVVWTFAHDVLKLAGIVGQQRPNKGVKLPKEDEKEPFKTMEEIHAEIAVGGLTEEEISAKWECLFLSIEEVWEFIAYCETEAVRRNFPRFVPVMIAAACLTGARRSELCRSETKDWRESHVQIREKKRKHKGSFRTVDLHEKLKAMVAGYLKHCEPSRWMFFTTPNVELTPHQATHYFDEIIKGSKWAVLKGWHPLRHSFASNLASAGVHQAIINAWMGHMTVEMQARYQHLKKADKSSAMASLTLKIAN